MERPVVVAVFERGELQSLRTFSPYRERWAAVLAAAVGATLVLTAMLAAAAVVSAFGLVVHAPTFFVSWVGVAIAVGVTAGRWVRTRVGRYRLGADIEADAFAMAEVDLVRRVRGEGRGDADYEVGLVPGMLGTVEQGRSTMPVESFVRHGATTVPLPQHGKIRIEIGQQTFVVTRRTLVARATIPWRERLGWLAEGTFKRLVRLAALGTPIAGIATLLGSVPIAMAMTDMDDRWTIPQTATALETEQYVRARAQFQAGMLHQCFDSLPLACQRAGYVGVSISLSKEGDVTSHAISRSTYGEDCPVTSCMENVVANWSFAPMRERMSLVIPIQVRRSHKKMINDENVIYVSPRSDAGSGCLDSESGSGLF